MADELGADAGAGLKALGVNCTLKKTPETSHTEALMNRVLGILEEHGVETEIFRPVDYDIKFGVSSDEGDGDEWPQLLEKFKAADIILMGMSIWFGVRSSVCQMVVERLDGTYNERNEVGQYPLYNRVGDAGPGPSYLDAGGPEHPYTQRTSSWCAHNLLHMARILRETPIPPIGNTLDEMGGDAVHTG